MGAEIKDEFAQLPISRQRKYYLRQRRDRRCTKCGKPVERGSLCLEHMVQMREYRRKTFGLKRRYRGSFSYLAEAAVNQPGVEPAVAPSEPPILNGQHHPFMHSHIPSRPPEAKPLQEPDLAVPPQHPLRQVKARVDQLLEQGGHALDVLDSKGGIQAKWILKSWVLMNMYSVRSPRLFCEQLGYNVLWLWFLDCPSQQGGFDPVLFEQAYERVLNTDAARDFFTRFFGSAN